MRSCALRIFDAATISIALVILRVLCTLLILRRISLVPAMSAPARESVRAVLPEVLDRRGERRLVVGVEVLRGLDAVEQVLVLRPDVLPQRRLEGQRARHLDAVEETLVHREQRDRLL